MPSSDLAALESADARIDAVLQQAKELAAVLPPLYTFDELCDIVADVDLAALNRHPDLEALYTTQFNPLIRAAHGSVEAYLRQRLGWAARGPDGDELGQEGEGGGQQQRKKYWERDDVTNVRLNDWRYAAPADVRHYVVWVDLPLFHPLLCTDPSRSTFLPSHLARAASAPSSGTATPSGPSHRNPLASPAHSGELDAALVAPTKGSWDHVSAKGLGGLTGAAERRFANPPSLQSVPGLAHFHVLARQITHET
ncbi:hypothetical protein DMC30DRAFT_445640 [Rhodotorula diobovata]|uniref:Uncharacterized protein n=1 Tax=Rhodotorula diobovata TaxID=5288 RepID=A0A5C5G106_9BASI|nr:hypothetical protein DMC30DRAFT_445640 [Rhodotorula diobovata]